jgi:peptidoglycan/LPS O-acetylase OafA/YrhL
MTTTTQPLPHAGQETHFAAHAYRPDIDGLRAVAVLMVVLFHAWPKWLPSGFIGVDIFFVISGFLITSIIIDDLERQRFSILHFYSRRVRRIFPALLLVMGATLLFGWAVLMRTEFEQLGKHIASGAGFVSNLTLWSEAGYFDADSHTKPLLHLWSLGVEEQFYIAWPLMMWLAYRSRARFLAGALVVFALSFSYCLYATFHSPTEGYFSPLTRFWELMAGGICAHLQRRHGARLAGVAPLLSPIGAVLLLVAAASITEQSPFPGWWALAPVLGTALLILAGAQGWLNRRVLSHRLAVGIGLVSYPFYLWHWPLLSFGYLVHGEKPPAALKAALVAAALVLAVLTYRLLELPGKRITRRRPLITALCVLMALLGVLGAAGLTGQLAPRLRDSGADRYLNALNDVAFPTPAMQPFAHAGARFQRIAGSGAGVTVFLGDSVMEQYGAYVSHALKARPDGRAAVVFATQGGCPPIKDAVRLPRLKFPSCARTVEAAHALARAPEVDTVVVGASWYGYFSAGYDGVEIGGRRFPALEAHELAYRSLAASLQGFADLGKRVFLVMPPPAGDAFDPRSMIEGSRFGQIRAKASLPPFDAAQYLERNAQARARLLAIARASGAVVIDPVTALCPDLRCPVVDADGEPVYTDTVHMRPGFSLRGAAYLAPTLLPARSSSPRG